MSELYPDSHVEIDGLIARYYENILNLVTFGSYGRFIGQAIADMKISSEDRILDMGAGSGYNAEFMAKYIGKGGEILGLDISKEGIAQFRKKFRSNPGIRMEESRIDRDLPYDSEFDKVLVSFVIHGLPQEARESTLENARRALIDGGKFYMLDYGEFELKDIPIYLRVPFRVAECKYAYDYLSRDWTEILGQFGFQQVESYNYLDGFTRLLVADRV